MILDKATINIICMDVYKATILKSELTGTALMKAIDDELEARGYYVNGETHDTPLQKYDPDLPPPTPPSRPDSQEYEKRIAELLLINENKEQIVKLFHKCLIEIDELIVTTIKPFNL
jgi:hypothetical protein